MALVLAASALGSRAVSRAGTIADDVPLAEVAAFVQARASFERHCFRCHVGMGEEASRRALERLDMSRYPFAGRRGEAAGRAVRKALGNGVGKATMPKDDPDSIDGEDLALILRWTDIFDAVRSPPRDKP